MTPAALLLALAGTALLVMAAGFASEGKKLGAVIRDGFSKRVEIEGTAASVVFGLTLFGVAIGIPVALGLVDTSVISLLGAPLCCMAGSWLLDRNLRQALSSVAWFSVMAWCASVPYLAVGSMSATAPSALQAVLGPLPLHQGPTRLVSLILALVAGSLSAARWVSSLPAMGVKASGILVRWGETALAGAVVFGAAFGPGLAAAAYGPVDFPTFAWTVISFGSTAAGVMLVAFLSKPRWNIPDRYAFGLLAALAASAMVGTVVA